MKICIKEAWVDAQDTTLVEAGTKEAAMLVCSVGRQMPLSQLEKYDDLGDFFRDAKPEDLQSQAIHTMEVKPTGAPAPAPLHTTESIMTGDHPVNEPVGAPVAPHTSTSIVATPSTANGGSASVAQGGTKGDIVDGEPPKTALDKSPFIKVHKSDKAPAVKPGKASKQHR